mmetsp:Transcript_38240/g.109932  ORF Transcript_38240/g.109932 Transcript_38240/m.109932 type:complete len:203 (+) Transcript_38240:639-1247(+)
MSQRTMQMPILCCGRYLVMRRADWTRAPTRSSVLLEYNTVPCAYATSWSARTCVGNEVLTTSTSDCSSMEPVDIHRRPSRATATVSWWSGEATRATTAVVATSPKRRAMRCTMHTGEMAIPRAFGSFSSPMSCAASRGSSATSATWAAASATELGFAITVSTRYVAVRIARWAKVRARTMPRWWSSIGRTRPTRGSSSLWRS